jgi:hypothetical protein
MMNQTSKTKMKDRRMDFQGEMEEFTCLGILEKFFHRINLFEIKSR